MRIREGRTATRATRRTRRPESRAASRRCWRSSSSRPAGGVRAAACSGPRRFTSAGSARFLVQGLRKLELRRPGRSRRASRMPLQPSLARAPQTMRWCPKPPVSPCPRPRRPVACSCRRRRKPVASSCLHRRAARSLRTPRSSVPPPAAPPLRRLPFSAGHPLPPPEQRRPPRARLPCSPPRRAPEPLLRRPSSGRRPRASRGIPASARHSCSRGRRLSSRRRCLRSPTWPAACSALRPGRWHRVPSEPCRSAWAWRRAPQCTRASSPSLGG
mmetsp:Transcript_74994/g.231646  ORF Transcript_74994/g.231646 Transcript_74994/m.231646 type:complete len:272 (-) Transcript_74994:911-1726(-)